MGKKKNKPGKKKNKPRHETLGIDFALEVLQDRTLAGALVEYGFRHKDPEAIIIGCRILAELPDERKQIKAWLKLAQQLGPNDHTVAEIAKRAKKATMGTLAQTVGVPQESAIIEAKAAAETACKEAAFAEAREARLAAEREAAIDAARRAAAEIEVREATLAAAHEATVVAKRKAAIAEAEIKAREAGMVAPTMPMPSAAMETRSSSHEMVMTESVNKVAVGKQIELEYKKKKKIPAHTNVTINVWADGNPDLTIVARAKGEEHRTTGQGTVSLAFNTSIKEAKWDIRVKGKEGQKAMFEMRFG